MQDVPTTGRLHIIVQENLTRGIDPTEAARSIGAELTLMNTKNMISALPHLNEYIETTGQRVVVFCSLQLAAMIRRSYPVLARGVDLPRAFLDHSCYTSFLAPSDLLNPDGLYIPWGRVEYQKPNLMSLYGKSLFIRPNSPMKPFPGFPVDLRDLTSEMNSRRQTDNVYADEMCYIAPAKSLPKIETRVWVIDGVAVSAAPYSWEDITSHLDMPDGVMDAAARIADNLAMREQTFTADFITYEGDIKLVELNALSTSGWYPGVDLLSVFRACDQAFV
jgi:hypothetical protein